MKRYARLTIPAILCMMLIALTVATHPARAEKSEEEKIAELNKQIAERGEHWVAGKTSVSGLSEAEKKTLLGLLPLPEGALERMPVYAPSEEAAAMQLPSSFDWRTQGGTTSAKNQLGCGSCWAFAAIGQLEAHIRIYDNRIEDLSEQDVIDCNDYGADCAGGWLFAVYEYYLDGGAVAESCIPYEARDDLPCRHSQCEEIATISGYSFIPNNISQIKTAVYNDGPVATGFTVEDNFYNYSSGCYDTESANPPNHAILIVGWDDSACSGSGAWIIKNSWGPGWGQSGFGYVKYGVCSIGTSSYTIDYVPSNILVHVTSPNGGETFDVDSQHLITWTTARETPDSLSVLLSIDGGADYDYPIATGLVGVSSFDWTVPNLPVKTCRVKVIAYLDGEVGGYDMSDANFTIHGVPYRYVSPTGGDILPYSIPEWAARNIQDAVDAADPGDTIAVTAATYIHTVTVDVPVVLMGGWNADFTEWDPSQYVTAIQFTGSPVSFMNVAGYCGVTGCTLRNGTGRSAQLPALALYGGGVFSYNSSPRIDGNVITNCGSAAEAAFSGGGGICCYGGSPTIENNEITGCRAQSGGGIYLYQTNAVIRNNRISGCTPNALFTGAKAGGAVYALHATASLEGNVFTENDGYTQGGGVYGNMSTVSLEGDSISANECGDAGGGVYAARSELTVSHVVITGNAVGSSGGGIYHRAAEVTIVNSIIALNEAALFGGGFYADSSWGEAVNNTIDRNSAVFTGGNIFLGSVVSLDLRNNMITHGATSGIYANATPALAFQYNNFFGNLPAHAAGFTPDSTNTECDPLYADTSSLDYHLLVHSCGIDGGDPYGDPDPDGSRADQGAFGGPGAVMAAPPYVANLVATGVSDIAIKLTWDGMLPGGLSSYAVYGDTSDGFAPGESVFLGFVPAADDTFRHEPVGGCRYYRVSAVSTGGYGGGYSNQSSACVAGADLIAPTVTVLYPNGGEEIGVGDTIMVQWIATDNRTVDSVSIYLSRDGGSSYELITHGEPNDSAYQWIVTPAVSDSCLLLIVAYDPGLLTGEDSSDSLFTIKNNTAVGDRDDEPGIPRFTNRLEPNYPNPFNGTTTVTYSIAEPGRVEIGIYDPAGRLVRILEDRHRDPGRYQAVWNGRNEEDRGVTSGVYFVRLKAGKYRDTKKIIYLR